MGADMRRFLLTILLLAPLAASGDGFEPLSANDGQLIMRGVPEIPAELAERVRQYQDVRSAAFLDWTHDGKGLYISTQFGDISQIHRVREAGGSRQQLTWYPEPTSQVLRRKKGRELAITMDRGGAEQDQIFLFDPRDASTRMLSDGLSRNRLLRWSRDGRRLAYQSTRRNGRSNDLWIMDPERPQGAGLLLEAPPTSAKMATCCWCSSFSACSTRGSTCWT
jgi:dipeptidyl aminopeptidase/acylaminoacyl peptidase